MVNSFFADGEGLTPAPTRFASKGQNEPLPKERSDVMPKYGWLGNSHCKTMITTLYTIQMSEDTRSIAS